MMMATSEPGVIIPDWPAPEGVRAYSTTRTGGISLPPFDSLNLALHVGDDPAHVMENRAKLKRALKYPGEPAWLEQVHGNHVVDASDCHSPVMADASLTGETGKVSVVMTADCLPVLFCTQKGSYVAAAHAGWRGLADGILEVSVERVSGAAGCDRNEILAWMGPAIGPGAFEVGDEVREVFVHANDVESAFIATRPGHWNMDIYAVARRRLQDVGVTNIFGGQYCTVSESGRFFSYRRDGQCGRMATMIWLQHT